MSCSWNLSIAQKRATHILPCIRVSVLPILQKSSTYSLVFVKLDVSFSFLPPKTQPYPSHLPRADAVISIPSQHVVGLRRKKKKIHEGGLQMCCDLCNTFSFLNSVAFRGFIFCWQNECVVCAPVLCLISGGVHCLGFQQWLYFSSD